MDYISIGSNGFAQVGDPDYIEKSRVEMEILIETLKRSLPIPEKFENILFYRVKSFPHDFGTYKEVVIKFNDDLINEKADSENEEDQNFVNEFWDFINKAESFDLESDILTKQIKKEYMASHKEETDNVIPFRTKTA